VATPVTLLDPVESSTLGYGFLAGGPAIVSQYVAERGIGGRMLRWLGLGVLWEVSSTMDERGSVEAS
jgi:hypothetical protein